MSYVLPGIRNDLTNLGKERERGGFFAVSAAGRIGRGGLDGEGKKLDPEGRVSQSRMTFPTRYQFRFLEHVGSYADAFQEAKLFPYKKCGR